jgi:predicted nucleic acid-binding protein
MAPSRTATARTFSSGAPVAIDTAPFVYLIEEHPQYLPIVRPVFVAITSEKLPAVTSGVTLLETLVQPYRVGNTVLAERHEALLTRSRGLHLVEITRAVSRVAAQLRAAHALKTPDALQLATALLARSPVFLTNNRSLPAIPGIRILTLQEYPPSM